MWVALMSGNRSFVALGDTSAMAGIPAHIASTTAVSDPTGRLIELRTVGDIFKGATPCAVVFCCHRLERNVQWFNCFASRRGPGEYHRRVEGVVASRTPARKTARPDAASE